MKQLKDGDIDEITLKINTRPRKKLNFTTPIEEYFNYLLLNMPEDRWTWREQLVVDGWSIKNGYYQLDNEKRTRCIAVYHPSTGYQWDWWHKVIEGQLTQLCQ